MHLASCAPFDKQPTKSDFDCTATVVSSTPCNHSRQARHTGHKGKKHNSKSDKRLNPSMFLRRKHCPEVALTPEKSPHHEVAIIATGCFWGAQLFFTRLKGVERVVVGYSGGKHKRPTYRSTKDHTEAVLIEYDPKIMSYEKLLRMYCYMNRRPYLQMKSTRPFRTQYRSAIWYMDKWQKLTAIDTVATSALLPEGSQDKMVYVDVEPATRFYRAEDCHQNIMSKH